MLGELSAALMATRLPVVKYEDCIARGPPYDNKWLPTHVHDDMCAGHTSGCISQDCDDACKGDSGGPVFETYNEVVHGVVRRGEYPCGTWTRPAIFTSTGQHIGFINYRSMGTIRWVVSSNRTRYPENEQFSPTLEYVPLEEASRAHMPWPLMGILLLFI